MNNSKAQAYKNGVFAEFLAVWYLRFKGYRILEQRYKTKVGEIDVIARKRNSLVFVEVKARQKKEDALLSVTHRMKQRISRAAHYYISRHPYCSAMDMRFDLITLTLPFAICHLDNAWQDAT